MVALKLELEFDDGENFAASWFIEKARSGVSKLKDGYDEIVLGTGGERNHLAARSGS